MLQTMTFEFDSDAAAVLTQSGYVKLSRMALNPISVFERFGESELGPAKID